MSNQSVAKLDQMPIRDLLNDPRIKKRMRELLRDRAAVFQTTILDVMSSSAMLKTAEPLTVVNACLTAAALDLPIGQNFGFAYIIPYKIRKKGHPERVVAQFQLGYRGLIQLALRTNQFVRMNVAPIYRNQFQSYDPLSEELHADMTIHGESGVVGYAAFFRMKNGFEKTVYWTSERVQEHAKRYSKSYGDSGSPWSKNPIEMGCKTVLKNTLSMWALVSVELQKAVAADQSVQTVEGEFEYVDNDDTGLDLDQINDDKERQRIAEHIAGAASLEVLAQVRNVVSQYGLADEYAAKSEELGANE